LRINDKSYDIADKEVFASKISEFSHFAVKSLPQLKDLKHKLEALMNLRDTSNADFNTLFKVMPIYEEDNMMCYTGGKVEKLVFTESAKNEDTLKRMDDLRTNLKNPVEWMYWWCRGEIYDIKALRFAIE
jgi:hypothetical protein